MKCSQIVKTWLRAGLFLALGLPAMAQDPPPADPGTAGEGTAAEGTAVTQSAANQRGEPWDAETVELFATLDWDPQYDYKAERTR